MDWDNDMYWAVTSALQDKSVWRSNMLSRYKRYCRPLQKETCMPKSDGTALIYGGGSVMDRTLDPSYGYQGSLS
jgi:hypothetical protein